MKKIVVTIFALFVIIPLFAQQLQTLEKQPFPFYSTNYEDTLNLDLLLPTGHYEANGKAHFPLFIVFDKQNSYTYSYNLRTIDMLVFQGQIPYPVVVGFPFEKGRRYYTSKKAKKGETITGIEKTQNLLFDELIPLLREKYGTTGPIILIGHSRTALLVNYLMANKHPEFEAAIAASGFYNPGFGEPELINVVNELTQSGQSFSFYFSLGVSTGESQYKPNCDSMAATLRTIDIPSNFYWDYMEHDQANHFTNYNLTLGPALTHYFGKYHDILDLWLYQKLENMKGSQAVTTLKKDLAALSAHFGKPISPSPVHIWSFMSHFYNKKDYTAANDLLKYGLESYPLDYEIAYQIAENYSLLDNKEACKKWMAKSRMLAEQHPYLTETQREDLEMQIKALEGKE